MPRTGTFKVEAKITTTGQLTDDFLVDCFSQRPDGERIWAAWDAPHYEEDGEPSASGFWIVAQADSTIIRLANMVYATYESGETVTFVVTLYSDYGVPFPTQIFQTSRYRQVVEIDVRRYLT